MSDARTITAFLLARIAEDEQLARAAIEQQGTDAWIDDDNESVGIQRVGLTANDALRDYLTACPPRRVLAECKAKRALIDHIIAISEAAYGEESSDEAPRDGHVMLAQPYADRPDFDPGWLS